MFQNNSFKLGQPGMDSSTSSNGMGNNFATGSMGGMGGGSGGMAQPQIGAMPQRPMPAQMGMGGGNLMSMLQRMGGMEGGGAGFGGQNQVNQFGGGGMAQPQFGGGYGGMQQPQQGGGYGGGMAQPQQQGFGGGGMQGANPYSNLLSMLFGGR